MSAAEQTVSGQTASGPGAPHVPVMLAEVLAALDPQPGSVIVDATFGAGGYSRALLETGATVHGFDRDPTAIDAVRAAPELWPELAAEPPRLVLHPRRFSEMVAAMHGAGVSRVDGVVMDIGVSSMQLDQAERGFAFSLDGPLDMRMSREGESAADFVNTAEESTIADVLYRFGEERQSRRVARAIVAARPLETTGRLAEVVRAALGYNRNDRRAKAPKDPATRSFQAIRIHVNGELDELTAGLFAAEDLLGEGGRIAVVSFHSLEDRIVKRFLRDASNSGAAPSRHLPDVAADHLPVFARPERAVRPSEAEIAANSRSRSAVLRTAVRTASPARPLSQRTFA